MELTELLKAHAQVLAIQRNLQTLLLQVRDLGEQAQAAILHFQQVKAEFESTTGTSYNEDTFTVVPQP